MNGLLPLHYEYLVGLSPRVGPKITRENDPGVLARLHCTLPPLRSEMMTALQIRCQDAILASPFVVIVTAQGQGPLKQYARESCLQRSDTPGQVYLRCECDVEGAQGLLLMVQLRDGFTFTGPIPIKYSLIRHGDEHFEANATPLGSIDSLRPVLLSNVGFGVLPDSRVRLHVYFDLSSSAPPSASDPAQSLSDAINEEKETLRQKEGNELQAHVCTPLPHPHDGNLEFVYSVARLRCDAVRAARERDTNFELAQESYDYLRSGLVDRLQGEHFAQRRQELLTMLGVAPNWRPSIGDTVLYRDANGDDHFATVTGVIENWPTRYAIFWIRQTQRSKLAHVNGQPLKADEVRSLLPGHPLVYDGYDVTVERVLREGDNADDDGVPRLEIKISRITSNVRPITIA